MTIEVPLVGKAVELGCKAYQHFRNRSEEKRMQAVVDEFRRRSQRNAGNCLKVVIGSDEDRLYSKMVAKGYLVRVPGLGYMLPEFAPGRSQGSLY